MADGGRQVNKAVEKLKVELGSEKVKSDDFCRAAYSSEGLAANRPGMPDAVILPSCEDDLRTVVKIANQFRSPLIPVGGRTCGLRMIEVPEEGAIVVDLTANMHKIIEIDEENLSVTAEAGATVYRVDKELRDKGYRLAVHPIGQPASISLGAEVAKCSIGVYGAGIGPVDRWILGLKAVLGNGDTLETGASRMLGLPHFQRYKLPDLTGLFMGSEGGLGIITEVTERILPLPVSIKAADFEFSTTDEGEKNLIAAAHEIRKKNLHFDMYWAHPTNLSFYLRSEHYLKTMTSQEVEKIMAADSSYGGFSPDKFGNVLSVVTESIVSEEEAEAREKEAIAIGERYGGKYLGNQFGGTFDAPENMYGSKTLYMQAEFGQRLNWFYIWSEFPWFDVPKVLRALVATFDQTDLPPSRFYGAAYFSAYGGYVTAYTHYRFEDPKEVEETLKWSEICRKEVFDKFGSAPGGVGRVLRPEIMKRLKTNCSAYLKRTKNWFDPNNIMNPGVSIWP